jgi:hypothetical protein
MHRSLLSVAFSSSSAKSTRESPVEGAQNVAARGTIAFFATALAGI